MHSSKGKWAEPSPEKMATCQGTRHNNTIYRCSVGEFYKKVLGRSANAKCEPCSTGSCVYFVAVFVLVSLVIGFLFISEGLVDDSDKKRKRELAAAKKLYEKCKLSSLESMDDYQNNSYELSDLQFLRIHRFASNYFFVILALDRRTARCSSLPPRKQLPERTSVIFYPREETHAAINTANIPIERNEYAREQ